MYAAHLDAQKIGFLEKTPNFKTTLLGNSSCLLADFLYSFSLSLLLFLCLLNSSSLCCAFPIRPLYPCESCPWLFFSLILNLSICISVFAFLSITFLQEKPFSRAWQNVHTVIQKQDSLSSRVRSLCLCHLTQVAQNSKWSNCPSTFISCCDNFHTWARYVWTDCKLPELAFSTTFIAVQMCVEEGDPREEAMKDLQFRYKELNDRSKLCKYVQKTCCFKLTACFPHILSPLFREKNTLGMLILRDGSLVLFSMAISLLRFQEDILQAKLEESCCWGLASLALLYSPCLLPQLQIWELATSQLLEPWKDWER